MTLATSGTISFGVNVEPTRSINSELRRAQTSTLDLNDPDARYTANLLVSESEISVANFYGKSFFVFGEAVFTEPGFHTWRCPDGVFSVSVVCIGGGGGGDAGSPVVGVGGGGGGGALAYRNDIEVVAGTNYQIYVGKGGDAHIVVNGTDVQSSTGGEGSYAFSCIAGGGSAGSGATGGEIGIQSSSAGGLSSGVRDGGGNGGNGGLVYTGAGGFRLPGGGGAGGYGTPGGAGAEGRRGFPSPSSARSYFGQPGYDLAIAAGYPPTDATKFNGAGGGGAGINYTTPTAEHIDNYRNNGIPAAHGGYGGGNWLYGTDTPSPHRAAHGGEGQVTVFGASDVLAPLGFTTGVRHLDPEPILSQEYIASRGLGFRGNPSSTVNGYGTTAPQLESTLGGGCANFISPVSVAIAKPTIFGRGGGGGGGGDNRQGLPGTPGAIRIIYPGRIRKFPGTLTSVIS